MAEPNLLLAFLSGAIAAGMTLSALFFLRFWTQTRDGLFLGFAIAFTLLALGQTLLTLIDIAVEERSWVYLLRLAAFIVILVSVFNKNRR